MPGWAAVIATLIVPGTGHLLLRRYLRGTTLAALWTASVDVWLISAFLLGDGGSAGLSIVSVSLAVVVWIYALVDVLRSLKALRAKDFQKRKDDLLRTAQVAWLRDELAEAEKLLHGILEMDERDVEAWVHLGKVQKALGRAKASRKSFRSALNLSGSDRWRWQLMTELGTTKRHTSENEPS